MSNPNILKNRDFWFWVNAALGLAGIAVLTACSPSIANPNLIAPVVGDGVPVILPASALTPPFDATPGNITIAETLPPTVIPGHDPASILLTSIASTPFPVEATITPESTEDPNPSATPLPMPTPAETRAYLDSADQPEADPDTDRFNYEKFFYDLFPEKLAEFLVETINIHRDSNGDVDTESVTLAEPDPENRTNIYQITHQITGGETIITLLDTRGTTTITIAETETDQPQILIEEQLTDLQLPLGSIDDAVREHTGDYVVAGIVAALVQEDPASDIIIITESPRYIDAIDKTITILAPQFGWDDLGWIDTSVDSNYSQQITIRKP